MEVIFNLIYIEWFKIKNPLQLLNKNSILTIITLFTFLRFEGSIIIYTDLFNSKNGGQFHPVFTKQLE